MKPAAQLLGQRVGRLSVLSRLPNVGGYTNWLCRCDCGSEIHVRGVQLTQRRTASCGCLRKDRTREVVTTHGLSKTRTYRIWAGMLKRCENTKDNSFPSYGGRGIKVCDRWRHFENFLADMGESPTGLTLDRYPDRSGNYEPSNCRWASRKQQGRNTSSNIVVSFRGAEMSLADACEIAGKKHHNVYMRMRRGATFDEAISL